MIDFEDTETDLLRALEQFKQLGIDTVLGTKSLGPFDRYIVRYFFDGITPEETVGALEGTG